MHQSNVTKARCAAVILAIFHSPRRAVWEKPWDLFRMPQEVQPHLLPPALVQELHSAAQGLDGLLEPCRSNQILQIFQHPFIVLRLPFGLHHGNLLHLPLGKQKLGGSVLSTFFFLGWGKYSGKKIYGMSMRHYKKKNKIRQQSKLFKLEHHRINH